MEAFSAYFLALISIVALSDLFLVGKFLTVIFVACVGVAHAGISKPNSRIFIVSVLSNLNNRDFYNDFMHKIVGYLRSALTPENLEKNPAPKNWTHKFFWALEYKSPTQKLADNSAAHPLGWPIFDWAMRISLCYPAFLLAGPWIFLGFPGQIGENLVLPPDANFLPRIILFFIVALAALSSTIGKLFYKGENTQIPNIIGWFAIALAVGLAILFGNLFQDASNTTAAVALVVTFSTAIAFSRTVQFSGVVSIVLAFVFTIVYSLDVPGEEFSAISIGVLAALFCGGTTAFYIRKNLQVLYFLGLLLSIGFVFTVTIQNLSVQSWNERAVSYMTFLVIFPLISAIFDFFSFGMTLWLMGKGLTKGGWWPIFFGFIDLAFSALLFIGSAFSLVVVISLANQSTGVDFINLEVVLSDLGEGSRGHVWIYLMVLTSFIPTVFHLGLSSASFLTAPKIVRRFLLQNINKMDDDGIAQIIVILLLSFLIIFSVTAPFLLIYSSFVFVQEIIPQLGDNLIGLLKMVSNQIKL